jgi:hypothetical protein
LLTKRTRTTASTAIRNEKSTRFTTGLRSSGQTDRLELIGLQQGSPEGQSVASREFVSVMDDSARYLKISTADLAGSWSTEVCTLMI